jgi:hypothetical protein
MLGFVMRMEASGGHCNTKVKSWLAEVRAVIEAERTALSAVGNVKAFAKWTWFKWNLEDNLTRINPMVLESDGPPGDDKTASPDRA